MKFFKYYDPFYALIAASSKEEAVKAQVRFPVWKKATMDLTSITIDPVMLLIGVLAGCLAALLLTKYLRR